MVFNGLQKSELVIFNTLLTLPRKSFYLPDIETLTGYCQSTIVTSLNNLREKGYISYYRNGRSSPYFFEIKENHAVLNA